MPEASAAEEVEEEGADQTDSPEASVDTGADHAQGLWLIGGSADVWASSDGASWAAIDLPTDRFRLVDAASDEEQTIVLAGDSGGLIVSDDAGQTWTDHSSAHPRHDAGPIGIWDRISWLDEQGWALHGLGVWTSPDPAGPWTLAFDTPAADEDTGLLGSQVTHLGQDRWVATTGSDLQRSDDGGATWSDHDPANTPEIARLHVAGRHWLATSAGTNWRDVQVSDDMGESWTPLSPPESRLAAPSVAGDGQGSWMLAAGMASLTDERAYLYLVEDGGTAWTDLTAGLPFELTEFPMVGSAGDGRWLVVGEFGNAAVTDDNGETWSDSDTSELRGMLMTVRWVPLQPRA